MCKSLLFPLILLLLLSPFAAAGQQTRYDDAPDGETVTFRFVPGDDMFYVRKGEPGENADRLKELAAVIDRYRSGIVSGDMPVYVDAYSTSLGKERANRNLSFKRANRVKSELIVNHGLKEEHFVTRNYAHAHGEYNDVVVVSIRIPVRSEPQEPEPRPVVREEEPAPAEDAPFARAEPQPEPEILPAAGNDHSGFYLRTNLLYDALLTPTIGVEWRVNDNVGVKLDGSWAHWGNSHGRVQKMWLVSPEVRWYLLDAKRFYMGLGANIGEANIYKGIASALSSDTGYQGKIYGGGVTLGYNLAFNGCLSMDFNLGLGVTHFSYDTFTVSNGYRVYKGRGLTKNFWGPTQAGVSLVWRVGGNK